MTETCKACRSRIIDACESIGIVVQELKTGLARAATNPTPHNAKRRTCNMRLNKVAERSLNHAKLQHR